MADCNEPSHAALVARIERDEALLRLASLTATALIEGEHDLTCCESAVVALHDQLRAAGFAPEGEWRCVCQAR